MSTTTTSNADINSSLDSIIQSSIQWLRYLEKGQRDERLTNAILAAILVPFFAFLLNIVPALRLWTWLPWSEWYLFVLFYLALAILGGSMVFLIQRRRKGPYAAMISRVSSLGRNKDTITSDALAVIDEMLALMPEIKRKRTDQALGYGILAGILTLWTGPVAIAIGVAVWLYFRYEFMQDYREEAARFREWKQRFDAGKDAFISSL
jgi:hypothetical protein